MHALQEQIVDPVYVQLYTCSTGCTALHGQGKQQVASQLRSLCVSGLANEKTVHICAGEDGGVRLSKSRPKHGNKPALFKHSTVAKKKNFRRTAANVGKDVHSFRPDLKVCPRLATCKPWRLFLQGVCVHLQDKLVAVCSSLSSQPVKSCWFASFFLFSFAGCSTGAHERCAQEPKCQGGSGQEGLAMI